MGLLVKLIGSGVGFASEAIQASRSRSTASSSTNAASSSTARDAPPEYVEVADEATADHLVRTGQAERVDKKPKSKAAEAGYEEDYQSSSDDEDEATPGNDEAAWELDDMTSRVAPPSYEASTTNMLDANDSEEVKIRKEEQMVREIVQMAGPPPRPSKRLPCAVIIPQRRPRDKTRGFVRAYAPVLHDCGIGQDVFLKFLKDWYQVSKVYILS